MVQQTDNPQDTPPSQSLPTAPQQVASVATSTEMVSTPAAVRGVQQPAPRRAPRPWRLRVVVLLLTIAAVAGVFWQWYGKAVVIVQPTLTTITESLTTTGRVNGVTETLIGAQATGIVQKLLVHEGDHASAGQLLAVLKNDVAEAQAAQAQEAVSTARAQLTQVSRPPLQSEVDAAAEQVRQARAQLEQQRAALAQAEQSVLQSRAQISQFEAERDLVTKQFGRSEQLVDRGLIAHADFDDVQARLRVAEEKVRAQQQALAVNQASVQSARAGVVAAQANIGTQEARLRTVQTGPRPEDIQVAQQRVEEAERAWRVARQQAENALVIAPFNGLVTAINAEVGQTVGAQGVLRLVSDTTEIRVDVDESNLADLAVGQGAILSSNTFRDSTTQGTVSKIAGAVDATRGTVMVTIVPNTPADWLRPGQTVNVNIVTNPVVQRLLVPATAVTLAGNRTGVLVVEHGRALHKTVVARPPTAQGVPVLAGLTAHDRVIVNTQGIEPGDAVRVRGTVSENTP